MQELQEWPEWVGFSLWAADINILMYFYGNLSWSYKTKNQSSCVLKDMVEINLVWILLYSWVPLFFSVYIDIKWLYCGLNNLSCFASSSFLDCNSTIQLDAISGVQGTLKTPFFPSYYPPDTNCTWSFTVSLSFSRASFIDPHIDWLFYLSSNDPRQTLNH